MYADPKHIKKNTFKISLNDDDNHLVLLLAERAGMQPSAYIREMALEHVADISRPEYSRREAV
jgi:hypothetical protein